MVLKSGQLWELKVKLEYICACANSHARSSDMSSGWAGLRLAGVLKFGLLQWHH